jgi:hypothetical protein
MSLQVSFCRIILTVLLCAVSSSAWSTRPLIDKIEIDGKQHELFPHGQPWLDYPKNDKTQAIFRASQCSAIGGLRATWKLHADQLWLTGFFSCSQNYTLKDIYGGSGEAILADWVSGSINVERGKLLCIENMMHLYEKTLTLKIERGRVIQQVEKDNTTHPLMPTAQDIKKLQSWQTNASEPWPCMTPSLRHVLELQDKKLPMPRR